MKRPPQTRSISDALSPLKERGPRPPAGLELLGGHDLTNEKDAFRVWALFGKYHPNFSGSAIQGHRVLTQLVRQGFSVTVLAAGNQAARSLKGQAIIRDGLTVRYLSVIQRNDWKFLVSIPILRKLIAYMNSLASDLSLALKSAWRLWREGHPDDIVQLFACNAFSFLPVWAARARAIHPVIRMTLVGSPDDPSTFSGGIRNTLGILKLEAFRRAEAIISISSALEGNYRSSGLNPDKIVRIHNGVDLQEFHPLSKCEQTRLRLGLGLAPGQRYIVSVGAAHFRKGIDVLIRALIQVFQRFSNVESLIVGPCDFTDLSRYEPARQQLVNELKDELEQAGYLSRVRWVGKVDNVPDYLKAADVFCLPTRREGFPTVIAEAMAVGLPSVVARLEGVTTDIIRSNSEGTLIIDHDPRIYADALMSLLSDPVRARSMGKSARARAVSEFGLEATGDRYAQLYRRLAGAAGN